MILKDLRIQNFRSYYGNENYFEFKDGLTLIIGDNGDGKTTFFEALEWLFKTETEDVRISHLSEKKKAEMGIGERVTVMVSLNFEHDGDKLLEKSFDVVRANEDVFKTENYRFRGYEERGSERIPVDGKLLINRCFDSFLRRFSMFKGESTLEVFDDPVLLKRLVDQYSDLHKFDDYIAYLKDFVKKSESAFKQESKNDRTISARSMELERLEADLARKIQDLKIEKKALDENLRLCNERLETLEKNDEVAERYQALMVRIAAKKSEKVQKQALMEKVNLNQALLDHMWILCAFPNILQEFTQKTGDLSRKKRRLNDEYIAKCAKEDARIEAMDEFIHATAAEFTQLPWYLPDGDTMQEMIDQEVCKVCGRKAEKGSGAYKFMVEKLEQYKEHLKQEQKQKEKVEHKPLFETAYIEELHNLSISLSGSLAADISAIPGEIKDRLQVVADFKKAIAELDEEINQLEDDRANLLIQAGNVQPETLENNYRDIKGYLTERSTAETRIKEIDLELIPLEKEMEDYRAEAKELAAKGGSMVKVYEKVNNTFERILDAFSNAKDQNLARFFAELEERANKYLDDLSGEDFHGVVRLIPTTDDSVRIELRSSNGTLVVNESGSQKTAKYIAVLFAISDMTETKYSENYPLFFDAATYAMGAAKIESFYNIIDNINKQCVILTKDFLITHEQNGVKTTILDEARVDSLTCGVYRLSKAPGYVREDLSTIQTIIKTIK